MYILSVNKDTIEYILEIEFDMAKFYCLHCLSFLHATSVMLDCNQCAKFATKKKIRKSIKQQFKNR
jgi:Zn finger protein HypA/HybF involved in hydrogenase expression